MLRNLLAPLLVVALLFWVGGCSDSPTEPDTGENLDLEDEFGGVWGGNLPPEGLSVEGGLDQVKRLDYDINLNPDTPSGEYKVVLRLISNQGPVTRLDNGESYLILDTVTITP